MTRYRLVEANGKFAVQRRKKFLWKTQLRYFCTFNDAGGNYWVDELDRSFPSEYVWRKKEEAETYLKMFQSSVLTPSDTGRGEKL